jgi:hypothetical protein
LHLPIHRDLALVLLLLRTMRTVAPFGVSTRVADAVSQAGMKGYFPK